MHDFEAFRLAHHDAICSNGGLKCGSREKHAKRNMSENEARLAVAFYTEYTRDER